MQLIGFLIVGALVVLLVVLTWNRERWQEASMKAGMQFGLLHPAIGAVVGGLAWIVIAGVLTWRGFVIFAADHGASLASAAAAALLSLAAVGTWAYAFAREYDVPPVVGRVMFWFSSLTALAAAGAFTNSLSLAIQVFCISLVGAFVVAMTPLMVVGWWRGRRDQSLRAVMSARAMTLLSGVRPKRRAG
jgi:hypothetical protein